MSDATYIVGIAMTGLGKFPARSVKDLAREAVTGALTDAGCAMADVHAAWFSNTRQGMMEGQNVIRGQCALRPLGFSGIPITNVENACASASTALREAVAHLRAGMCDVALVVGAEKMFFPDQKEQMLRAFVGGADVHMIDATREWLAKIGRSRIPEGSEDSVISARSFFMDYYAGMARMHMERFGTTQRQIAAVAAKNHVHSTLNPLSQYRTAMSVDEVLGDALVKWPLTRSMCAPISDGAAAAVVCHERALARFDRGRAVRVAAVSLASGSNRDDGDYDRHIGRVAALDAYASAGIDPSDIGVAEVHDACSFAEILQAENLGFCERGAGGWLAERGCISLGGSIPVNPSGGLVSKGHPVGATGLVQLYELVAQLRGEAGARQVDGVRLAVAENGGGLWGIEEAATAVTILEAPSRMHFAA
ncbi:MAG: thiolase family protein [Burkholderiaceae bacterium]|nr:thiolase family protein [Burkholderiaceae bacterium]